MKESTVVAKRIRTYCYFIRKIQMKVKRSNISRKTVMFVPEIQCVYLVLWFSNVNNHFRNFGHAIGWILLSPDPRYFTQNALDLLL